LLLFVVRRERVDSPLLGDERLDSLLRGLLCDGDDSDCACEVGRIVGGRMQLFVEKLLAAELAEARDRRAIESECDTCQPA
jgi:hypothetical protein